MAHACSLRVSQIATVRSFDAVSRQFSYAQRMRLVAEQSCTDLMRVEVHGVALEDMSLYIVSRLCRVSRVVREAERRSLALSCRLSQKQS